MIDLKTLEVFYWVVRLGGFGRAAEKLHTTQPAVSVRIKQLEERYNIQLFHRAAGQRPQLTPRGRELYAQAERMLELDRDIEAVLTSRFELRGLIRISVDISSTLRAGLLTGEIDLAILLGPLDLPRVREVPLCSYDLVWAAKPGLAVATDLAGLGTVPILTFARATRPTQMIADTFARAGLPAPRLYPNSSLAATVRMALDGIGVCIVPRVVIVEELARGTLSEVAAPFSVPPLDYVAAYVDAPHSAHLATVAAIAQACAGHKAVL